MSEILKRHASIGSKRIKLLSILLAVSLFACNGKGREGRMNSVSDSARDQTNSKDAAEPSASAASDAAEIYSNERFREVNVQKIDSNRFVIQGKAQIFEANFGWVVEDGHHELKKGFEMTDAGAPAWGNFMFPLKVEKPRPNSTLTLVLYESSAKDGSRQHELVIPLP